MRKIELPIKERLQMRCMPEPNTGCWLWTSYLDHWGYGIMAIDRKPLRAHRLSYSEYKGDPSGFIVRHDCDNPCCINPDHLSLGTNQQNMDDMVRRGRSNKGEKSPLAKLDELQVRTIRKCLTDGMPSLDLSKYFKVGKSTIWGIKYNHTWKHI